MYKFKRFFKTEEEARAAARAFLEEFPRNPYDSLATIIPAEGHEEGWWLYTERYGA